MGMIPRVSQRKKDVKISRSVVGKAEGREESRWRTRWEKARGRIGFFSGNSWVPDWGVQAGWSNSEVRNSKLVVSRLNSHRDVSSVSEVLYKYLGLYFKIGSPRLLFLMKNHMTLHY